MTETVKAQNVNFDKNEIRIMLERLEPGIPFKVIQLVYYPYFFFEYVLERKKLLYPIRGTTGCTVDAIDGVGSLIDNVPDLRHQELAKENMIQPKLTLEKGEAYAEKFLYEMISLKLKVLSMPKLEPINKEMFFRPYWIVYGDIDSTQFSLAVDAVSAKYHPL